MNQIRRILIACALIVGAVAITKGANEKESIHQDIERSPEKRIDALIACECESRTNLNLRRTYWCPSCRVITVNGKLCREGETINGFKITSITKETIVFLCPEGHSLELPPNIGPVKVTAIYWSPVDPLATINDENYRVGDTVNGHTIIEIRKTEVVFRDPQGEEVVKVLLPRTIEI